MTLEWDTMEKNQLMKNKIVETIKLNIMDWT